MAVNFVNIYMPAYVELAPTVVADTRERLETHFKSLRPDLATEPNTVLGDLVLTPQAYQIAAIEEGMERFMSDLDLGNVANNVIYNCDFVEQYLKNFGAEQLDAIKSSGVLRLVFSEDKDYVLDRGVQFQVGQNYYSIYLPCDGPFLIKRVGTSVEPGENGVVLKDSGTDGGYFADVPVVSNYAVEAQIEQGTPGLISVQIPELGSIAALTILTEGFETLSLASLAKRTRSTIYSASMNTRNGAVRYINTVCPFVESCYAIRNGDSEMLRNYHANAYGVSTGCLDMYARSSSFAFEEVQSVRLYLSEDGEYFGGDGTDGEGHFDYVGQPYYVTSITHPSVNARNIEHEITSRTNMGALEAYTQSEKLYIKVKNIKNSEGNSIFEYETDETGRIYTTFTVTYRTDPLLPYISSALSDSDNTPINTSVLVKGFTPVIIRKFNVNYVKNPGVIPDLELAKERIKGYFDALGAPNAYSDAEIARMMQESGVKYVPRVDVNAYVQWAVGDKITDFSGNLTDVPKNYIITSTSGLRPKFPGVNGASAGDMYACSIRTVRYYTMEDAISFTEVKEM